jgi:outer membrane lipoprotein-sorting protein
MAPPLRNILVALMLTTSNLHAQSAADALRTASARFKALASYSATIGFVMGTEREIGKVYYLGNLYRSEFPEDQTIFDGKSIMSYAMGFGAVSISEPSGAVDYSLGGIYDLHRFAYDFAWIDTMFAVQHLELTAKDDALMSNKIQIGISKKTGLISSYSVAFRDGFHIDYIVIEEALNPALPADLFEIDWDFVKRAENGEVAPIEHHHEDHK